VDSEHLQPWLVYGSDSSGVRAVNSSDKPLTALALTDASVSWTNAGQPLSAPLGSGPGVKWELGELERLGRWSSPRPKGSEPAATRT
jgi:hypothetical protein